MKAKILSLLAASLFVASPVALAAPTLVGTQVTIQYLEPGFLLPDPDPETVTVAEFGAEVVCPSGSAFCNPVDGVLFDGEFIDIGEDFIRLGLNTVAPFADPAFFSFGSLYAGTSTTIVGVQVAFSNLVNLDSGNVTFGINNVLLDMSGVSLISGDANGEVLITLVTLTEPPGPEPIPEPSTYVLLGAGLLGLLALRRRSPARAA
jgi:hypothetical protein